MGTKPPYHPVVTLAYCLDQKHRTDDSDQPPDDPDGPGSGNSYWGETTMLTNLLTRAGVALQSKFVADDKGASAVEYGLIVGLIAAVIIAAVTLLGTTVDGVFDDINGKL